LLKKFQTKVVNLNYMCISRKVGRATGWMIGGSSPGRGWKFFSSLPRPDRLWSPLSLPIQWVPGALFLGVKRAGR